MNCPKCQTENDDNRKFCRECGAKLANLCPECNFENQPGDKFCGECGLDLQSPAKIKQDSYENPRSYTPVDLVQKILDSRKHIEGERKLVTVFFADVAGFTTMSEKNDPEDIRNIMDGCFEILMKHIHRYEGTITQFLGDGLMALFGAPLAHEDHARRACLAGLAVQKDMVGYGETVKQQYGIDFKMRIGLNSGTVIVGSVGDDLRMDYTAVGDTVNLASRMETAARHGTVLISRNVHNLVKAYFEFKNRGELELKGKQEAQEAYELIAPSEVDTRIKASASKGFTRFVGRKKSMGMLMDAYHAARSGSGQIAAVVGDAGVGKSRLLIEFHKNLPQGEYTYLEGQCFQYGGNMIYLPILAIIKSLFEIEDEDQPPTVNQKLLDKIQPLDSALGYAIPPLQDLLSLPVEDKAYDLLEPRKKRERIFDAVMNILIKESKVRPIIIAIEDMHWIDSSSQDLINYLIGWLTNASILLLVIYRPEYKHQWGGKSYYTQIRLDQLGEASSMELIQAILEEGEVAPELRNLIMEKAAGNPLYVEEFTQSLIENGNIKKENNRYIIKKSLSGVQVPDTIQGIIASRMDRLEENLKRIMQVASVIGRDFAFKILQTITGGQEELKSTLFNLQGLEFIYEKQLYPELEYIFKHALIQEVAYNSLLQKRRKEIHERIGQAIEKVYIDRLEEFYEILLHHYSKAGNQVKLGHYLYACIQKALVNHAHRELLEYCRQALEIHNKRPENLDVMRAKIYLFQLMWEAYTIVGFSEESLSVLKEAERVARDLSDNNLIADFTSEINFYYINTGDAHSGINYLEQALDKAIETKNAELAANLSLTVSYFYTYKSAAQIQRILKILSTAIDLLEANNRIADLVGYYTELCARRAYFLSVIGDYNAAEELCDKALQQGRQHDHRLGLNNIAEFYYGWVLTNRGFGKQSIPHLQSNIADMEESVYLRTIETWANLGWAYYLMGNFNDAQNQFEKSIKMQDVSKNPALYFLNNHRLSQIHADAGDLQKAMTFAENNQEIAENENKTVYAGFKGTAMVQYGLLLARLDSAQFDESERLLKEGTGVLKELEVKPDIARAYQSLGAFFITAGRFDEARKYLEKASELFTGMGMEFYLARANESTSRLHKLEGDIPKAREHLTKAIDIMKGLEAYGWVERYEKELAGLH
ncbi:AAA family ATPase [bacterium]|nr:AAA family ATPase [bacterium]